MLFIAFAIYIYTRAYNEIIFFLPVSVTESKTRKKTHDMHINIVHTK